MHATNAFSQLISFAQAILIYLDKALDCPDFFLSQNVHDKTRNIIRAPWPLAQPFTQQNISGAKFVFRPIPMGLAPACSFPLWSFSRERHKEGAKNGEKGRKGIKRGREEGGGNGNGNNL